MAPLFSLRGALVDDNVEDQRRINAVLLELYELQSERPSLFNKAPYTIKMRSANETARLQKMLDFSGPDARTTHFLQTHKDKWLSNPDSFWEYSTPPGLAELEPQARIRCSCILLVEFRTRNNITSVEDTATALFHRHGLYASFKQAKEMLASMIDAGHRYKNLERLMGTGVVFVLGTSLSESYWTKLLPKSGPKFENVMNQMRAVHMPSLAEEYAALQVRVVECFLSTLVVPAIAGPLLRTAGDMVGQDDTSAGGYGLAHPYETEWEAIYFGVDEQ